MKQMRKQFSDEMSLFPVPCFLMEMKLPAATEIWRGILDRLVVVGLGERGCFFMDGERDQIDCSTVWIFVFLFFFSTEKDPTDSFCAVNMHILAWKVFLCAL